MGRDNSTCVQTPAPISRVEVQKAFSATRQACSPTTKTTETKPESVQLATNHRVDTAAGCPLRGWLCCQACATGYSPDLLFSRVSPNNNHSHVCQRFLCDRTRKGLSSAVKIRALRGDAECCRSSVSPSFNESRSVSRKPSR